MNELASMINMILYITPNLVMYNQISIIEKKAFRKTNGMSAICYLHKTDKHA